MKLKNILHALTCFALAGAALMGCSQQEMVYSNAVATEYTLMTFDSKDAEPQALPVYSDGFWSIECVAEWIDIKPLTGYGKMDVTVTVKDNFDAEGVEDFPREATIYFKSGTESADRNTSVVIRQRGDKYKGIDPVTVSKAKELAAKDLSKFTSVQVMATALNGLVIADETGVMYVDGTVNSLKAGDVITLAGEIETMNGQKAVKLDEETVKVISEETPEYSNPKDVSAGLDSYEGAYLELVSVKGSLIGLANEETNVLSGAEVHVPGATKLMMGVEAAPCVGMAEANYHFVTIVGYYWEVAGKNISFIPAKIVEDGGVDEGIIPVPQEANTVLFSDNFDWMEPFVAAAAGKGTAIGDSVGENNASGAAPNLYTTDNLADLRNEMERRGYVDINAAIASLYPQYGYWKFGKTSAHTGLQLPPVEYYGDLDISFIWSPQMTGSGNIDKVILIVEVVTGSSVVKAAEFSYESWKKGQLEWKPAKASIQVTPQSLIRIRPISLVDYSGITQQRFYLDNIVVKVPGPDIDPVYADIEIEDDLLTFNGVGGTKDIKITSDQDFTLKTRQDWISFDVAEGKKGMETTVKVTCEPSDLSELRQGAITILSGDSQKVIRVIQSAAGQDLDPFISVGQNSIEITGKKQEVKVPVQATGEYTVTSDAAWVTLKPEEETKAMVTKENAILLVEANPDTAAGREAHVTFAIESAGVEAVLTIRQAAAEPDDPNLIFSDDFSWLSPAIAAYNAKNANPVSDFVNGTHATLSEHITYGNNNSPKCYDFEPDFSTAFNGKGYTDLNAGVKVIYLQGTAENPYLKFCKGNTQTAIALKPFTQAYDDVEISLDWAIHMTTSALDVVHLQFKIDGEGTFANGTKTSDAFDSEQTTVAQPFWSKAKVTVSGVNADTKIVISSKEAFDGNCAASGQHRFYIDNVCVRKFEAPKPLNVEWALVADHMNEYKDLFGGTAGVTSKDEGFGVLGDGSRMRVPSTSGEGGNIYFYQVDKNSYTPSKGNPKRIIGATGDPYITGGWPGDYWLIEGNDGTEYAAGTKVNVNFLTRVSASGQKYMLAEYWDGEAWKPAYEVKTETETGTSAQYNFVQATSNQEVNATWTLAKNTTELKFRFTIVANWQQQGGALANPNGGTCRIAERCALKVVTE